MPMESHEKWQHLSHLLDQVLDLEEPERAQWLEKPAQNEPEMAERLSAALAARERTGFTAFLAGSAIELPGIGESTLVGRQHGRSDRGDLPRASCTANRQFHRSNP